MLFRVDADGRLVDVNEPDGGPAPRLFLARGRSAARSWFRADVSSATAAVCRGIVANLPPWDGRQPDSASCEPLRAALSADGPLATEVRGPAFRFGERAAMRDDIEATVIDGASAHLLERYFPYTRSVLAARRPVVGVVVDGAVVSACFCARRRPWAAEAGVATEAPYRGRGFGLAVVAAWRDAVEREGAEPLYSTSWDNAASLALARSLSLIPYADTLALA